MFIDDNLKTSCRSLMYWLCKFITAAFIWTHDIKLEIRHLTKKLQPCCTPCLFIMLAVKTGSKRMTKFPDTTVHTYTYSYRIKKIPLWRAFSKISEYGRKIRWIRVDTSRIRKKKNLRFHRFPDTCGRCLNWAAREWSARLQVIS